MNAVLTHFSIENRYDGLADGLATYDPPTKAEMDTAHGLLATEAKQDIIDTNVDSVLADTNELQTDEVPGLIAALPTANENADALLKRDWTAVSVEASRSVLNAPRFLRIKWSVSSGTLTVRKEDDSTSAWAASVTTDCGADPVTASDPT